ncbi:HD domain-containing phosphohydrolase [Vibrio hangzhouensis]|uniref:HD domain-containing phosphohydrolase n=1 Tax=Vibrio hangzhouensis TaxID=462991 RepID=UPI001C95827A|nr:HD domain-containing phosphohydrolase [Vibrio hangzhouensis]MBY6196202.1 transporter substrate-binding domain-containing protein [Vibrio hangzhouensis]
MKNKNRSRFSIRRAVAVLFTIAITATALISASVIFSLTKNREIDHALSNYQLVSSILSERLENFDLVGEQAAMQLKTLLSQQTEHIERSEMVELFGATFLGNPFIYSIYIGFENDHFIQLINLRSQSTASQIHLLEGEAWMVVEHLQQGESRVKLSQYYLDNFELSRETVDISSYYPTRRGWFTRAEEDEVHKTAPYLFYNLKVTGQTFSIKVPDLDAVIGVDIALNDLHSQLAQKLSGTDVLTGTDAYIVSDSGRIISSNQNGTASEQVPEISPMPLSQEQLALVSQSPLLKVSNQLDWEPIDFALSGQPYGLVIDLFTLLSKATGLQFEFVNGRSWEELTEDYNLQKIDILQSVAANSPLMMQNLTSDPLYELGYSIATHGDAPIVFSLDDLEGRIVGILKGWSIIDSIREQYPDITIYQYDNYEEALHDTRTRKITGVLDVTPVLKNKVTQLVNDELKLQPLAKSSLLHSRFYFVARDELKPYVALINEGLDYLKALNIPQQLKVKWLDTALHHTSHLPDKTLLTVLQDPMYHNTITPIELNGGKSFIYISQVNEMPKEYFVLVIPEAVILNNVYAHVLYSSVWTLAALVIMIPFVWRVSTPLSKPIKRLVTETKKIKFRQYDKVSAFESPIREVNELSAAILDMAKSLDTFQRSQDAFIESIIQLIARAIDEKSPYTGAHCLRVPELAFLLSDAAEKSDEGIFESFRFNNRAERRQFRIAAWLHDCGKITTPEYVVDKGSKLETNYNRIHEIRTRFEVLWRDAEINALKAEMTFPDQKEKLQQELKRRKDELVEQFGFIAQMNIGNEFITEQNEQRIHEIGQQTWCAHFDPKLGLSPLEEQRLSNSDTKTSRIETLLSDKPEHIIPRDSEYTVDPKLGIQMEVPEHLYNLGELYNLTISRGTLTKEERFKINEHMIAGIKMLSSIPFPEELKEVERIATTHHETMKGTGYPRRLKGEELSIPERILAIADIFEALTAADRPYKKAKTVSESLDILHKMALDEHVDIQVFQLFIRSKVYLDYAHRFLAPSQIDEVDERRYLLSE